MLGQLPFPLALLLLSIAGDAAAAPKSSASVSIGLKSRAPLARSEEEFGMWAKAHRQRMITKYGGTLPEVSDIDRRAAGTNLCVVCHLYADNHLRLLTSD